MCENFIVANGEIDNIFIQHSPFPKIQSQYVWPISSRVATTDLMEPIINLINNLLNNDGNSLGDFQNDKECEEILNLHLTHLHTKVHNI